MRAFSLFVIFMLLACSAGTLEASQGYFGGRGTQDGSINMRQSTTQQFNPIRGQSVASRPRPDFDPTPMDLGSFQLFSSAAASLHYDSNVYAQDKRVKSDAVWKLAPAIAVNSNWGRHAMAFTAQGDLGKYTEHDAEDVAAGSFQLEGRYDILAKTWAAGFAGYQRGVEPRSSPDVPGGAAGPTQFDLFTGGAELYRGLGRLKAKGNYGFSYRDFDAVTLLPTGSASQRGRNRFNNSLKAEVQYEVSPNLKPFLRGTIDWMRYTQNSQRDSNGYGAVLGAQADFGGVVTAEVFLGLTGRSYDQYAKGDVLAADFGGEVAWNVTELTSLQGEVARSIEETTLGGVSAPTSANALIATGGSVTLTHELLRNLVLEANASYTEHDYQNAARVDGVYGAGFGARYFISRNFYADGTYNYSQRSSDAIAADYARHVALLRFGAQY